MKKVIRARRLLLPVFLLLLPAACGRNTIDPRESAAQSGAQPVAWRPCPWTKADPPAQCAEYTVYENRLSRTGRTLKLPMVLLPAREGQATSDPVVFLTGGPGLAATTIAPGLDGGGLDELRKHRDFLFVDQRGTGENSPLRCDLTGGVQGYKPLTADLFPANLLRQCAERWDADSTLYSTPLAVEDLEEIREALGYTQLNLYGSSYGTRYAQVYLRQHPGRVRTVVLEAVVAMSAKIPLPFARGSQRSLDRLFEDCASQPACAKAFPRLREEFRAVLDRLEKTPARAALSQNSTTETVEVNRDLFTTTTRSMLYFMQRRSQLPWLIHEAYEGRFAEFARRAVDIRRGHLDALALYLAVVCADDVAFIDPAAVPGETAGTFLGEYWYQQAAAGCQAVPHGTVAADYHQPVRSNVPALLLSGYLDPSTPPEMGDEVAAALPNSVHVKMPNRGHGTQPEDFRCADRVITDLIQRGTTEGLDTSCLQHLAAVPFAIAASASRRPGGAP